MFDARPTTFGSFDVRGDMGEGRFGPVYFAHDPHGNRPVVVRTFTMPLTDEQRDALVEALRALCESPLDHLSIAQPFGWGVEHGHPYLVHAYLAGTPADEFLRSHGPLPLSDVGVRLTSVAGAIDFAAAAGVHHGVLTARDIIFDADRSGVSGFGLVQALHTAGVTDSTPTQSDDVRALAGVAFELLTGAPYAGQVDLAGAAAPGVDIGHLESTFRDTLTTAGGRYSTALAFVAELQASQVSTAVLAVPMPAEFAQDSSAAEGVDPQSALEPEPELVSEPEWTPPLADATPSDWEPSIREDITAASRASSELPSLRLFYQHDASDAGDDLPVRPRVTDPVEQVTAPAAPIPWGEASSSLFADPDRPALIARPKRRWSPAVLAIAILLALAVGFGGGIWVSQRGGFPAASADSGGTPQNDATTSSRTPPSAPPGDVPVDERAEQPRENTPAPPVDPPAPPVNERPDTRVEETPLAPPDGPPARTPPAPSLPPPPARPPAPQSGGVLVHSIPSGARVTINGRYFGDTPVAIRQLALGTHTIEVSAPSYPTWRREITLSPDRPTQAIEAVLDTSESAPAAGPIANGGGGGSLHVDSDPAGAQVFVNGALIGRTPLLMSGVNAGAHDVRVELSGYRAWSTSVRIGTGSRSRVSAALDR